MANISEGVRELVALVQELDRFADYAHNVDAGTGEVGIQPGKVKQFCNKAAALLATLEAPAAPAAAPAPESQRVTNEAAIRGMLERFCVEKFGAGWIRKNWSDAHIIEFAQWLGTQRRKCGCVHGDSDPNCQDPLCPNFHRASAGSEAAPRETLDGLIDVYSAMQNSGTKAIAFPLLLEDLRKVGQHERELLRKGVAAGLEEAAKVSADTVHEEFRKGWLDNVQGPRSEIVAKYTARAIRALDPEAIARRVSEGRVEKQ